MQVTDFKLSNYFPQSTTIYDVANAGPGLEQTKTIFIKI
jgi:hypothetical protein